MSTKVSILMCTYNGAQFLDEQLLSIREQNHKNWQLFISDDGSTDQTESILRKFQQQTVDQYSVELYSGPCAGFVSNFLSLVHKTDIQSEYYAFCDQDDIWLSDHIERAVTWLEKRDETLPAIYCSRSELIDEHGNKIGFSPLNDKPASFKNALVQNIASGNTMVFNQAARNLFESIDSNIQVPFHDWLLYLLVTGAGGDVHYSHQPSILYRQHRENIVGSRFGLKFWLKRLTYLVGGRYAEWVDMHALALKQTEHELTDSAKETLHDFLLARKDGIWNRCVSLRKIGVYRHSRFGNFALAVATLLKRV